MILTLGLVLYPSVGKEVAKFIHWGGRNPGVALLKVTFNTGRAALYIV